MPNKTKCSESRRADYKAYKLEDRGALNKELKIEKHLKKHPEDKQSVLKPKVNYKKRG